jgi:hypothetical protein
MRTYGGPVIGIGGVWGGVWGQNDPYPSKRSRKPYTVPSDAGNIYGRQPDNYDSDIWVGVRTPYSVTAKRQAAEGKRA